MTLAKESAWGANFPYGGLPVGTSRLWVGFQLPVLNIKRSSPHRAIQLSARRVAHQVSAACRRRRLASDQRQSVLSEIADQALGHEGRGDPDRCKIGIGKVVKRNTQGSK